MKFWTQGISHASVAARAAKRAETDGWDGWSCVDSQNLAGDTYVGLALAAEATERIMLGPSVTNSVTRHPAVTAAAIASIQVASGGRAVLGIGRGDSALAHVGRAPDRVADFERYLSTVSTYLHGDAVAFDELPGGAPPVAELGLDDTPPASKLHWLRGKRVPIEVAGTGPKVIAAAARHADRVLLAVGADLERLAWGVELARSVRPDIGIGAFLNVGVADEIDVARDLVRGGLSTFARFSVMHGTVNGPADEAMAEVLANVHANYDMNHHTQVGSAQAQGLPDDFVDRFAVVGTPDQVTDRLRAIEALGIDKVVVVGSTEGSDRGAAIASNKALVRTVLPALR